MQPLAEPLSVNSTQPLSLSGKLYLSIPAGPCPSTPQAFVQSLAGASIVTPPEADLISLQPSAIHTFYKSTQQALSPLTMSAA